MNAPPRLLIAAAASSSGKTTLSLLFCMWARRQNLAVASFKCGPDFIDSQYLEAATGRPCINLDAWMAPQLERSFALGLGASVPQVAVIEGVMGLYDGKRGEAFGRYSSAECSKDLRVPVIVVLNARKSGQTLATQVLGLQKADPKVRIAGVVLNEASAKSYSLIAPAIKKLCKLPVFGWLPKIPALALPERHLGLSPFSENSLWAKNFSAGLGLAEKTVDFKGLLKAAKVAPKLALKEPKSSPLPKAKARIAIARDAAFHFYYHENLQLLRQAGAELVPFSPLKDKALPENIQGLLIGGGFPEIFGSELENNEFLRRQVGVKVLDGLATWAECGGLMYLCGALTDLQGRRHAMAGALPGEVMMTKRLQNFGYVEALAAKDSLALEKGKRLRGHEFHHSELHWREKQQTLWQLKQEGKAARPEGYALPRGLATYVHSHWASNPEAAKNFVAACLLKGPRRVR